MDRLTLIETFVQVADSGGFSKAADRMGLSKSVVSKYVSALEDHLGARLFNRTTRRLSLTEVGAAYRDRCQAILADLAEAEHAVGRLHAEPRGVLRLNVPMSFGQRHIGSALPGFLDAHPDISIHMELSDRFVDVIEEGYDLAIRIGALSDSSLIARRITALHRIVVAAPSYLERHGRPRHPDDLATHQCMVYTMRNSLPDWDLTHRSGQQVLIEHPSRLTANSGDALVNAAVSGAGLVLAPTFIIHHHLAAGRLERVLPDWQGMGGAIHAVYPPNRHLSAKVRVFIDYLIQRFGREVPYWDQGLDLVTR